MTPEHATARLEVDLAALLHNYRVLQGRAGAAEVAPVVKADAYGLGAEIIARHLANHGAKTFFVARLDEGIALRRWLGTVPTIYVFDGPTEGTSFFSDNNLRPVLNSLEQVQFWQSSTLKAALHIDTGMNRLGIRPEDIAAVPNTGLSLIMSHLACADEPGNAMNARQLKAFRKAADRFPEVPCSLANSAGHFLGSEYAFDVTRPGISLYGGGPFGKPHPDLKPVAHLSARVLQVRDLKAGESVGYSATYTAARDMRLATVGIGYADGLLRRFAGAVTVAGQSRPVVGRVSMDVISIDVTGLDIAPGDWVEILGDAQMLDDAGAAAGTVSYELLTRLGSRISRFYK
ncbi:MAG TPA: alanine racemase [Asticcacaulis sp.]|nr:alanine racemase [Asticcacaulis sp.]